MRFYSSGFSVQSRRKMEIIDVTSRVDEEVKKSGIKNGLVNVWVPHTTASVAVNEHDTDLWEDIIITMEKIVPINGLYHHNAKYSWMPREQNAHAHILNCLIKPSVTLPLEKERMALGKWQSILFIEIDGPQTRRVNVYVLGE